MNDLTNKHKQKNNKHRSVISNSPNDFSNIARKDIENSYNIKNTRGTEAYYSNRYGWTLRKIFE